MTLEPHREMERWLEFLPSMKYFSLVLMNLELMLHSLIQVRYLVNQLNILKQFYILLCVINQIKYVEYNNLGSFFISI